MHGKHSWHVSGSSSQDTVIWQNLYSEVVEYIRQRQIDQNRGVFFSFPYRPDSVISSGQNKGETNKAQAEIYYYDGSWHTENGDLVKPTEDGKWRMAPVRASLGHRAHAPRFVCTQV